MNLKQIQTRLDAIQRGIAQQQREQHAVEEGARARIEARLARYAERRADDWPRLRPEEADALKATIQARLKQQE